MKTKTYLNLKAAIIDRGYANEIDWSEKCKPCEYAENFFMEFGWVVVNSGMKNQIAKKIWTKIIAALNAGNKVRSAFGHPGKAAAIQHVHDKRVSIFNKYILAVDKIQFLEDLPWIGPITKFHLAKNLGFDCCKPDRHLVRIAESYKTTPEKMCARLAKETGDRIATVDLVIWRAANLQLV